MRAKHIVVALEQVSRDRIRRDLRYLCSHPLTRRTVRYTRPGVPMHSLAEADRYIAAQLESAGYEVDCTTHRVQAFRCDSRKPLHHWYSDPEPDDPWFDVDNLEVSRIGTRRPSEIVQLVSHKDSMSWIDSPGAHDNACGTAVNLEIARVLSTITTDRTVRILFCNEEHTPWTSRFAADAARDRGDTIVAVLNQDALDGKSNTASASGKMTHAVVHSTPEGRRLAENVEECARRYGLRLDVSVGHKERINDDDGMFINAGYRSAVMNIGSWPYGDSEYHLPGDVFERVNVENLSESAKLLVAAVLTLAEDDTSGEAKD